MDLDYVLSQIKQARLNGENGRASCFVLGCLFYSYHLQTHINRSHPEYCNESCPNCPARFVENNDLKNHQRNGCPRRKQKRNRKRTKVNRARVHDKFHTCENCQKSFGSEKAMKQHQRDKQHGSTNDSRNENLQHCENFDDLDFSSQSKVNSSIKNLQSDESYRHNVSVAVGKLRSILNEHMKEYNGYSVNKIIKGGSLGKGTAVRGKADIDCVIFFNNLKTMQDHKINLEKSKRNLKLCLQKYCNSGNLSFDCCGETQYAVKAKVTLNNCPDASFDVDLLPTFNADIGKSGLKKLYNEILSSSEHDRQFYSAALVELQRHFVSEQPANVKDLIRLVKFWRKTCVKEAGGDMTLRLPSSYPLELITIHCWEEAGIPSTFDTRLGFKTVLECLKNYSAIRATWYENYDQQLVDRARMSIDQSLPFVLDPANPTNNVCSASSREGWEKVADAARKTLQNKHLKSLNQPWV